MFHFKKSLNSTQSKVVDYLTLYPNNFISTIQIIKDTKLKERTAYKALKSLYDNMLIERKIKKYKAQKSNGGKRFLYYYRIDLIALYCLVIPIPCNKQPAALLTEIVVSKDKLLKQIFDFKLGDKKNE